jgi:transcriptional regulator with XRE-family HTH domain
MTDYQRIAKQIGFTISQLAAIMGYTRQALYKILSGESNHERFRWALAVRSVRREIEDEYRRELDALNARYDQRRKAADELLYINTVKGDAE